MKKLVLSIVCLMAAWATNAQVTTLYGNGTIGYYQDGLPVSGAEFANPYSMAYDHLGQMWISDQNNNFIILISNGKYFIREGYQQGGFKDGAAVGQNGGLTNQPAGIIAVKGKSGYDQVYLCDAGNHAIRKIDSFVSLTHSQTMRTVSGGGTKVPGQGGQSGIANGPGATALFNTPTGLGFVDDGAGGYLVIADKGNQLVRKVSLHKSDYGATTTLVPSGLKSPEGIFVDANKNNAIYLAESAAGGGVSLITPTGFVTNVVPGKYLFGPTSVVVTGTDMFIADGCRIMHFDMNKAASASNPSVFAGNAPDSICDFNDGANSTSLFNGIGSMILSTDGKSLIVADAQNNRIRQVMLGHTNAVKDIFPKKDMFSVYPNPAFGHIIVKSETSSQSVISLYNITGQQVLSNKVTLLAGSPYDINIENQTQGVYILQVSTETGVYSQKIVVR